MIEKTSTGMTQGMIAKLVSVLEATLSKLGRYDEGSLIGSILSFTVSFLFFYTFNFFQKILHKKLIKIYLLFNIFINKIYLQYFHFF